MVAVAAGKLDSKARYWGLRPEELEDWLKMVKTSRSLQQELREPEDILRD